MLRLLLNTSSRRIRRPRRLEQSSLLLSSSSRMIPLSRRRNLACLLSTTTTTTLCSSSSPQEHHQQGSFAFHSGTTTSKLPSLLAITAGLLAIAGGVAAALPAGATSAISSTTAPAAAACEEPQEVSKQKTASSGDDDDNISTAPAAADDGDPYENLPEDDEDTDCFMCRTFRQGPCRPHWRKLERCFKDHESSSAACVRYFTPHNTCLADYVNLYQLISLNLKQELVHDAELAVQPHERRCWNNKAVVVDWSTWKEFYKEMGPSFRQTIPVTKNNNEAPLPLWKRLPDDLEPVLISAKAVLPMRISETDDDTMTMMLKIAYAVDQDGMVLGLSYNKAYGNLLEQAKPSKSTETTTASGSGSEKGNDDDADSKKDDSINNSDGNDSEVERQAAVNATTFDLEFHILPGETKSVRVCAMYSENPVTADPDKDILDVLLYKSRFYNLASVATEESKETESKETKKEAILRMS